MSSDEDDYGFEYSDDDMSDGAVDIENQYYNSKGMLENSNYREALAGFKQVLSMENEKGSWGFKAYKQIVKLQLKMGAHEDMLESYRTMLTYTATAVTKNAAEKKINSLLDFMSACEDTSLLQRFYELTLESQDAASNERLWFKASLRLCDLSYQAGEFARLARALKDLHARCAGKGGAPDLKKATLLLEVYALEIQMHSAQKNYKAVKLVYDRALSIKSAIPHPRILGIVRECGGKMHMREKAWEAAHTDFFEAFKSFDDAGSPRRVQCLKYLVLASMLMGSHVDPFNAQETKPYRSDPQVEAMTSLVSACQENDIERFQRVLSSHRRSIMADPFVRPYMEDLMTVLRTQVLLNKVIGPYSRVRIPFVASRIKCTEAEAERLLASLILDGRIRGHIDQVKQILVLEDYGANAATAEAEPAVNVHSQVSRWAAALDTMQKALLARSIA